MTSRSIVNILYDRIDYPSDPDEPERNAVQVVHACHRCRVPLYHVRTVARDDWGYTVLECPECGNRVAYALDWV